MSTDLTKATDDQLKAELKRREDERKVQERLRLEAHQKIVLDHIDALLSLVPTHGRTSCSDENPCNAYNSRCQRCSLLKAKEYRDASEIQVTVQVTHLSHEYR
jgi:hypothetical protein